MTEQQTTTESIASNFMLVRFSKGFYSPNKPDKEWSERVAAQAHVTQANAARVYKNVLAGVDSTFKEARAAVNACYTFYLERTMPFNDSERHNRGDRIIPIAAAMQFQVDMDAMIQTAQGLIDQFANEIPLVSQQALVNLGTMADPALLPTPDEIRAKCYVEFQLDTLPANASTAGLSVPIEFANLLAEQQRNRASAAMDKALGDLTRRVSKELSRIVRVSGKVLDYMKGDQTGTAPSVYESLRDNIAGLTNLMRDTADSLGREDLMQLAEDIRQSLTQYEPNELRNSVMRAEQLHKDAKRITSTLSSGDSSPAVAPRSEIASTVADAMASEADTAINDDLEIPDEWSF